MTATYLVTAVGVIDGKRVSLEIESDRGRTPSGIEAILAVTADAKEFLGKHVLGLEIVRVQQVAEPAPAGGA